MRDSTTVWLVLAGVGIVLLLRRTAAPAGNLVQGFQNVIQAKEQDPKEQPYIISEMQRLRALAYQAKEQDPKEQPYIIWPVEKEPRLKQDFYFGIGPY